MSVIHVQRDGVIQTYTLLEKLGKGSYSQVYKCKRECEGKEEIFAVKVFNKSFLRNERTWKRVNSEMQCHTAFEKVELEIALMKKLCHPNLVKLIDVIDDESMDRLYMVIEYIEKGQIMVCNPNTMEFTSPITHGVLPEDVARHYLRDIISGLKYLHIHKVVHRDIKPENLLITNDNHVKIVDFGVAHLFDTCANVEQELRDQLPETKKPLHLITRTSTGILDNTAGTIYFYAPEITTDQPYNTYAADIWAVGVTLYIMVTGKLPIYNPDLVLFFDDLIDKEIEYPSNLSPALVDFLIFTDLLKRFLCRDPLKRVSIDEIINHPWMQMSESPCEEVEIVQVDRKLLSDTEINDALATRLRLSPMTPLSETSEVPSDYQTPMDELEENETIKKKKELLLKVTDQVTSSKCCIM